jgi:argininosuccinate lyase
MKLWEKGISTEKLIEEFTVGNDRELDIHLAKYDLQASIAHAQMLEKVDLLSSDECTQIVNCLNEMLVEVQEGSFSIEENFEDVHSKIEYELIQRIGEPGKKNSHRPFEK